MSNVHRIFQLFLHDECNMNMHHRAFFKVRKSQIPKFLRYASPQIANPQIFIISPRIKNPQIAIKFCTTHIACLKTLLKAVFLLDFVQILILAFYTIFVRRKSLCLWNCVSFKSVNHKQVQIRKVSHLRKVRKSNKLYKFPNMPICDLRNLIAWPPSFEQHWPIKLSSDTTFIYIISWGCPCFKNFYTFSRQPHAVCMYICILASIDRDICVPHIVSSAVPTYNNHSKDNHRFLSVVVTAWFHHPFFCRLTKVQWPPPFPFS